MLPSGSLTALDDRDKTARVVCVDAVAMFPVLVVGLPVGDRVLMWLMPKRQKFPASVHFELQVRHSRQGVIEFHIEDGR